MNLQQVQSILVNTDMNIRRLLAKDRELYEMSKEYAEYCKEGILQNDAYDCSEIAEDLLNKFRKGNIYEIKPTKGIFFNVMEYGEVQEYVNHYVYVYKGIVFDARLFPNQQSSLIDVDTYKKALDIMNKPKGTLYSISVYE